MFIYSVKLPDGTFEKMPTRDRAYRLGRAIRAHALKTGKDEWREANGRPYYVGPGAVLEAIAD